MEYSRQYLSSFELYYTPTYSSLCAAFTLRHELLSIATSHAGHGGRHAYAILFQLDFMLVFRLAVAATPSLAARFDGLLLLLAIFLRSRCLQRCTLRC